MKRIPNTSQSLQRPGRPPRATQLLAVATRIASCLVVAWTAVTVLQVFQRSRTSPQREVFQAAANDRRAIKGVDQPFAISDVVNGHWQFAGFPWQIGMRTVAGRDLQESLLARPELSALETRGGGAHEEILLPLLTTLGATSQSSADLQCYRVDNEGIRIAAFAASDTPRKIRVVRVAQRTEPDSWALLEATCQAAAELANQFADDRLLPTIPTNERLAVRIDKGGRLQAELIDLNADFADLRSLWLKQGWRISTIKVAADDPQVSGRQFLCRRNSTAIVACHVGGSSEDEGLLLTLRTP